MKSDGVTEWIDRLRTAAMKAVSEDDMRLIFQGLTDRAKKGDAAALKLLMTYLQPPPPPPAAQLPAQQVRASTVNIYAARRPGKKPPKLLKNDPPRLGHLNGHGSGD